MLGLGADGWVWVAICAAGGFAVGVSAERDVEAALEIKQMHHADEHSAERPRRLAVAMGAAGFFDA
jgi:hypothetical protein